MPTVIDYASNIRKVEMLLCKLAWFGFAWEWLYAGACKPRLCIKIERPKKADKKLDKIIEQAWTRFALHYSGSEISFMYTGELPPNWTPMSFDHYLAEAHRIYSMVPEY